MSPHVSAVIVAGGAGRRMGTPKQFLPLGGKPLLQWSLEAFAGVAQVKEIVLVVPPKDFKFARALARLDGRIQLARSGATRMESVRRGVRAASPLADVIAVHDGARPLVASRTILECLRQARRHGAALPAVPAKDTLKRVRSARRAAWVEETPPRSQFWHAQTPQCYRREVLLEALRKFPADAEATDESQLVEKLGRRVRIVKADETNIKVTTPADLAAAEAYLGRARPTNHSAGFGFDIHRLAKGRRLILGGVLIAHSKGLVGHSDGDVVLHACCDAVLGGCGLGDIGKYFPSRERRWKDVSSLKIAGKVMRLLKSAGAVLTHLDATVVAQEPRLSGRCGAIRAALAFAFGLAPARVNFKAKTHEGLGEVGRGEAISCYAVASLSLPS